MKKVSLIIPCYNEEQALPIFAGELDKVRQELRQYDFEVLMVNDGSSDKTLETMKKISEEYDYFKYLSFSRNFGKEAAMYAGFCNADGDYVAVMDADMQDPPSLLPEMLGILEQGEYDSVATRRVTRKGEPPIRSWFARMFYKIINKNIRLRCRGWRQGFQAYEGRDEGCHRVDVRVQQILQGNIWLDRVQDKMAGIRECGESCGRDEVELLEAFQIRTGRNNQLLRGADEYSFRIWNVLYICLICHDAVLLHKKAGVGRPCCGMAVTCVHHTVYIRTPVPVHRNNGQIYRQDIYGDKEQAALYNI